ncbi:sulfotransferase domain-containing protein [Pseudodesulfovibrio tunisiensis]|uniref:sulfotransferase domain-containing protein n=1 Tax=Pseudodesulfovibrio tunisiensis TaxID=463192 RepID=UPI001FB419A4|nr:sulfotransferase domain-containing protein [Pseudodesulfovibrio tunisiensis]
MPLTPLYANRMTSCRTQHLELEKADKASFDAYVSSFPRSGNTWVRKVLSDYALLAMGREPGSIHQDTMIPDIHVHDVTSHAFPDGIPYKCVKSHAEQTPFSAHALIHVVRRPEDALVSFFHFHNRYPALRQLVEHVSIDDFCLVAVQDWIRNACLGLNASGNRKDMFLITYETLSRKTFFSFFCILKFLGVQVDESNLEQALANNDFQTLQAREKRMLSPQHQGELFFRKGRIGSGKQELQQETLKIMARLTSDLYASIHEREQRMLTNIGKTFETAPQN